MPKTKCPHCGTQFETSASQLEAINYACRASTIHDPEVVIGDYKLFFRGYMEAVNNIDLVGMCIATNTRDDSGHYVVIPKVEGAEIQVQPIRRGEPVDVGWTGMPCDISLLEDPRAMDALVAAKTRAMEFLKNHIENLTAAESAPAKEENSIGN